MRENNRKSIERCRKKLPQFTTMNVIDGQAGLVIYSSLIFYSLTIDNILNIIVLLILAGVTIVALNGDNGILTRASDAKENTVVGGEKEQIRTGYSAAMINKLGDNVSATEVQEELNNIVGENKTRVSGSTRIKVKFLDTGNEYEINNGLVSEYVKPEITSVYAKVFDTNGDSTGDLFVLSSTSDYDYSGYGTLITDYGNKNNSEEQPMGGDDYWDPIWYDNQTSNVETVIIRDKIVPKSCSYWFCEGFTVLKEIRNIENLDTSNVESMDSMFLGCLNIEELDLSSWDTSNVTNMNAVFDMNNENKLKNINLAGWDTSNVTIMRNMFYGCNQLTSIDVSGFDTSNVTDMAFMFYKCSQLTSLDIHNFNMSKVSYGVLVGVVNMFEGVACKIELGPDWTDEMKTSSKYKER